MAIQVIIADDHAVVRDGIKAIIEHKDKDIKVTGEASDGKELLELAKAKPADVYIVDISMPVLNGVEATRRLLKAEPKSRVIMLSMHDDSMSVEKSLKAGARGFIVKASNSDEILQAIHEVCAGRFYLCAKVSKYVVQGFLGQTSSTIETSRVELTPKEREILQLIAEGYSSKEIAQEFGLSLNTVHVHRNNIMRKLDIHKQADLIRYALKEGITHL
ncbi:MAG: response regulator transcription factor [Elusimicrobiales bacterium]|nr:response regulator transcription factor [Elusimicrobiales bacterium]